MRSPSKQPVPLRGETRVAILATRTHAKRVDDEYERRGTASIFLFAEPLCAFRQATARPQRTQSDWALEVAHLWDTRQAKCEAVTRASDNLHTHTRGAFYEAFPPEQARASVKRLDLVHTPKHGSGLRLLDEHRAENEPSSVTRPCVAGRRFGDIETLRDETAAWSTDVNSTQRDIDWHLKIDDARGKLTSVYPKIKL